MANFGIHVPKAIVKLPGAFHSLRKFSSALFIPGSKATETFSYLTPYLDYDERFADLEKLKKNMEARGIKDDINELKKSWDFYKYVDSNRKSVEEKRESVAHQVKKLGKKVSSPEDEEKLKGLHLQGKTLKEDLRIIREALWDLEEVVIPKVLKLPNELDEKTPEKSEIVLKTVGTNLENEKATKSHLEIGKELGLIEYTNPLHYYLCNEAAHFEIGALTWAGQFFSDNDFLRVAGTDFARSLVVEATGLNHEDPYEAFLMDNNEDIDKNCCNRLHLIGGASLISFLVMHTKQLINPKSFPLRYFATGRQYVPAIPNSLNIGLYGVSQTSAVETLVMVPEKTSQKYQEEFQNLVDSISKLYDELMLPYRVVLRPANQLKPWESLRVSFEVWSAFNQCYMEVGHVSACGDFFSKRLLIAYQTPTGRGYPGIISGTVLSVHKLLACLMEQNQCKFLIPQCINAKIPN